MLRTAPGFSFLEHPERQNGFCSQPMITLGVTEQAGLIGGSPGRPQPQMCRGFLFCPDQLRLLRDGSTPSCPFVHRRKPRFVPTQQTGASSRRALRER